MKKNLFLIFFLFFTLKIFACRCPSKNIAQDYLEADFVGIVTITKTSNNDILNGNYVYKAEVNFNKIIKGQKLSFLNVFGIIDKDKQEYYQGCSLYLKTGEKYLAVLKKNKKNEFWVNGCSQMIRLSYRNLLDEENKTIERYANLFENIERYKNQFSDLKFEDFNDESLKRLHYPDVMFHSDFGELRLSNPSNKIGIYKIFVDKNLKVKQLIPIKRVGEKDIEIEQIIFKNLNLTQYWKSSNKSNKSLLLLYFDDFEPAFQPNQLTNELQ